MIKFAGKKIILLIKKIKFAGKKQQFCLSQVINLLIKE